MVKVINDNGTALYTYDVEGTRRTKQTEKGFTKYYVEGNKILGEDREPESGYSRKIRYFYDITGIAGFELNNEVFHYVKDIQNNVVLILDSVGEIEARYEYDLFGNCKIFDKRNNEIAETADVVGTINPFRWKSFYYDQETGLYYANGSYYDPDIGQYLDMAPVSTVIESALTTRSLDRNALVCNNIENTNSLYFINCLNCVLNKSFTEKISKTIPSIPQWLGIATIVTSNLFDFSVYARTAGYMIRYSGLSNLMRLDGVTQLPGKYTSFINGLAYGFVAMDTALDIYTNIQQGKSTGYVIGSAVYTAATGAGIVWVSGKIGAVVGTVIGGPVGAILGGIAGIIVGVGLTIFSNILKGAIFK